MGEMTSGVAKTTAPPIASRRRHGVSTTSNSAIAQPTARYSGLTRIQHPTPSKAPAPSASQMLLRLAASSSNQFPPSTNHMAGTSAEGYAAYMAKSGDSAARKPAAI